MKLALGKEVNKQAKALMIGGTKGRQVLAYHLFLQADSTEAGTFLISHCYEILNMSTVAPTGAST